MQSYSTPARRAALVLTVLAAVPVASTSLAAAEDEALSIEAFSAFGAEARIMRSSANTASLIAELDGIFYVMTEKGPVANGDMACIGTFDISLDDGGQTGSGKCSLTAADGAMAFGTWVCDGYHLVGCQGQFTVTGGTGRLEGLTGEGPVIIRSAIHDLVKAADGTVAQTTEGIAFWPKLDLAMPTKPE